jgi:hypothetical protein
MWLHTANPFLNEKDPPLIAPGAQRRFHFRFNGKSARCKGSKSIQPNALGRLADAPCDHRPIVDVATKSVRVHLELLNQSTSY